MTYCDADEIRESALILLYIRWRRVVGAKAAVSEGRLSKAKFSGGQKHRCIEGVIPVLFDHDSGAKRKLTPEHSLVLVLLTPPQRSGQLASSCSHH